MYVGGYYLNTDRFCPAYWINGKAYPIPTDINSQIYSISVDSNGDVYLGGSEGPGLDRRAAYWKNGEMTAITEYANACIGEIRSVIRSMRIHNITRLSHVIPLPKSPRSEYRTG